MNRYTVRTYNVHTGRDERQAVEAATAHAAIVAVLGKADWASRTCAHQNHVDPAVRDNCHVQVTGTGTIGAAAWREGYEEQYRARPMINGRPARRLDEIALPIARA